MNSLQKSLSIGALALAFALPTAAQEPIVASGKIARIEPYVWTGVASPNSQAGYSDLFREKEYALIAAYVVRLSNGDCGCQYRTETTASLESRGARRPFGATMIFHLNDLARLEDLENKGVNVTISGRSRLGACVLIDSIVEGVPVKKPAEDPKQHK